MNILTVLLNAPSMPTGLALAADTPFSDPSLLPKSRLVLPQKSQKCHGNHT
jgi:hypothetical protein